MLVGVGFFSIEANSPRRESEGISRCKPAC
jgi:hypothetical protein